MATHPPVVVGLTICRNVFSEGQPGEVSLTRVFTGVRCTSFPARMDSPLCVLAFLTDGEGDVPFDLLVTWYGDTIEPLQQRRGVLRFPDRHRTLELVVRYPQFVFPRPGVYLFTLSVNGEWAAQRGVRVHQPGGTS
ncbi:MAG: hypothetical protein C0501_09385 [Isosphaera sp.]|nr:hypothetical protein [Isosphaera sp.]